MSCDSSELSLLAQLIRCLTWHRHHRW